MNQRSTAKLAQVTSQAVVELASCSGRSQAVRSTTADRRSKGVAPLDPWPIQGVSVGRVARHGVPQACQVARSPRIRSSRGCLGPAGTPGARQELGGACRGSGRSSAPRPSEREREFRRCTSCGLGRELQRQPQVSQDAPDDLGGGDEGDQLPSASAVRTDQDIDLEGPLHQLRPCAPPRWAECPPRNGGMRSGESGALERRSLSTKPLGPGHRGRSVADGADERPGRRGAR